MSPSHRQANVPFEHRCLQLWALSALPQCGSVQYPIPDWPAVRPFAPYNGPRNEHELGPHFIAREPNLRIAMAAKIDELEVRGKVGVRQGIGVRPSILRFSLFIDCSGKTQSRRIEGLTPIIVFGKLTKSQSA